MRSIQITSHAELACGTVLLRYRRRLFLAVVAKGRAELVPRALMRWVGPATLLASPQYEGGDRSRPVRVPPDLVPPRPRVDVTMVGHGYASRPDASAARVRLCVYRGIRPAIDKTLEVRAAQPFGRLPLAPDFRSGAGPAPTVFAARAPDEGASFGPIDRLGLRISDHGVFELADDLSWSSLQWAPDDQQLDALDGDEWIVLQGTHSQSGTLRSRLPGMRVVAEVERRGATRHALAMPLRALHIDADEGTATLAFVGSLEVDARMPLADLRAAVTTERCVAAEADAATVRLGGAAHDGVTADLRSGSDAIQTHAPFAVARGASPRPHVPWAARATPFDSASDSTESTMVLGSSAAPSSASAPFALATPGPRPQAAIALPGAPWSPVAAPVPTPAPGAEATMQLGRSQPQSIPEPAPVPRGARDSSEPANPPERAAGDRQERRAPGPIAHQRVAKSAEGPGTRGAPRAPVPVAARAHDAMGALRSAGAGEAELSALELVLRPPPPPPDDEPPASG